MDRVSVQCSVRPILILCGWFPWGLQWKPYSRQPPPHYQPPPPPFVTHISLPRLRYPWFYDTYPRNPPSQCTPLNTPSQPIRYSYPHLPLFTLLRTPNKLPGWNIPSNSAVVHTLPTPEKQWRLWWWKKQQWQKVVNVLGIK